MPLHCKALSFIIKYLYLEILNMIRIAPSILSADFLRLGTEVESISSSGGDWVHFDVMDGVFVPNISVGIPVLRSLRKGTDLFIDAHLMIVHPRFMAEAFCDAGADLVTIHLEADELPEIRRAMDAIHEKGKLAGISVKPATPAKALLDVVDQADLILVMTVEPGFGGQHFMNEMLPKIREVRRFIEEKHPGTFLEVDGGINDVTIARASAAGADVFVAGTSIFGAADAKKAIADLRAAAVGAKKK